MSSKIVLSVFNFETVTVDVRGQVSRQQRYAQFFVEALGNGVGLDMISIPSGTFLMGASETEGCKAGGFPAGYIPKPETAELPQHRVTVPAFFLGKHPVTQTQWQAIVALPQVNKPLNPDPSYFKGAKHPVDTVSWQQAEEVYARLSAHSGKQYRFPSEAEWEFACRAGTRTHFCWGDAYNTNFANHIDRLVWSDKKPLKTRKRTPRWLARRPDLDPWRSQTTAVDQFPPNAFGLYDMHGNVWEWCADPWHFGYDGAPNEGNIWETEPDDRIHLLFDEFSYQDSREHRSMGDSQARVVRGGSFAMNLFDCRSASRRAIKLDSNRGSDERDWVSIGLRLACSGV